jgi:hypothetical protein
VWRPIRKERTEQLEAEKTRRKEAEKTESLRITDTQLFLRLNLSMIGVRAWFSPQEEQRHRSGGVAAPNAQGKYRTDLKVHGRHDIYRKGNVLFCLELNRWEAPIEAGDTFFAFQKRTSTEQGNYSPGSQDVQLFYTFLLSWPAPKTEGLALYIWCFSCKKAGEQKKHGRRKDVEAREPAVV